MTIPKKTPLQVDLRPFESLDLQTPMGKFLWGGRAETWGEVGWPSSPGTIPHPATTPQMGKNPLLHKTGLNDPSWGGEAGVGY